MKQFYLLSTLLCALAISNPVSAQITIDEVKTDPSERILKNEVRPTTVDAQSYFSRARYRAERAAIRKERNTLEFGGGILGSVASYSDSWIETSGGDNSIGLAATLFLHHTFTKQRFTIETKFDAKFGYNRMNIEVAGDGGSTTSEATWYKNQDEFQISTNPAYIINKSWQVGSIIKFRSQFANGYVSRSQQTADDRKSTFMSPGYLDISGGFTYTCPLERFPIKINLSPIALSAVFADILGKKRNVGKLKIGRNLLDALAGVLQLADDMFDGILVNQRQGILSADTLDDARQVFGRIAELPCIILQRAVTPVVGSQGLHKTLEDKVRPIDQFATFLVSIGHHTAGGGNQFGKESR